MNYFTSLTTTIEFNNFKNNFGYRKLDRQIEKQNEVPNNEGFIFIPGILNELRSKHFKHLKVYMGHIILRKSNQNFTIQKKN